MIIIRYQVALLCYRVVVLLLLPLVLLALLFRSLTQAQYRARILERLGFLPDHLKPNGIVVHAASVGEVLALKPFIEKLLIQYPDTDITLTTFTPTGSAQVDKLFAQRVQHVYLPIDNIISSTLFLRRLKPKAMIFMETELWPNLIAHCRRKNIALLLINGRLSKKSITGYAKLAWLITPTVQAFDDILTQSEQDKRHYQTMGALAAQCHCSGNLKFDITVTSDLAKKQQDLAQYLPSKHLPQKRPVWLLASSHQGDETLALRAFELLKQQHPSLLLIIVPRHPERFTHVAHLAAQAGNRVIKRSDHQAVSDDTNVWLIDSLGELLAVCALANVVTMGGSFNDVGGHNPLEPALFRKPLIVGHNMSNFKEITSQLTQANAMIQLTEIDEGKIPAQLATTVSHILTDEDKANKLGENAYQVVLANQGATDLSLAYLAKLLTAKAKG